MKTVPTIMIALAFAGLQPAHAAAGEYNVYLTASENTGVPLAEPATQFSCSDKIYGVVEINHADGKTSAHTLHATWQNPAGEDQELTEYQFQTTDGYARIWIWLKLHRSGEASLMQFANPSAGMEEFIGQWEIEVRIDGDRVARKNFEVLC